MLSRRGFLTGLGATALAAPAIIKIPNLLMPIKPHYPEIRWYNSVYPPFHWNHRDFVWESLSVDGRMLAIGDKLLLTKQTNSKENGLYRVGLGTVERVKEFDDVDI